MLVKQILKKIFIALVCVCCISGAAVAVETNEPLGDIGEYGNWINFDNNEQFNNQLSHDVTIFQNRFESNLRSTDFVPIEVRLGLIFMKALSAIDVILQMSLVRYTIMFLFIMYAFWIALEAYKTMRDTNDYKNVFYDIFKKGMIIAVWVLILNYGPAKIFNMLITPVMALGTYLSSFILDAVAETYNVDIPDTCAAIHNYVDGQVAAQTAVQSNFKLLVDADAAANIMCLPARLSVYFYHATATGFRWMISGFGHSTVAIIVGAISIIIFVKCIFKYAFMTLGIVADLFLTLLMLPFTAIAEAMPSTKESNYAGQIFSGILKLFNTKKLSDVISVFINTTIYFASLAIVIAICAALLSSVIRPGQDNTFTVASGMTTLLTGCFILYLANKAEELAAKIGGKIDNSLGQKLQSDAKTFWGDTKKLGNMFFKDWLNKK